MSSSDNKTKTGDPVFLNDLDRLDALVFQRLVAEICSDIGDLVDGFDAFGDLSKRRVLAIEMRSVLVHDEELRRCGVGIHGSGHGKDAPFVLEFIDESVGEEFS